MTKYIGADRQVVNPQLIEDLEFLHKKTLEAYLEWDMRVKPTPEYRAEVTMNMLSNLVSDYILSSNDNLERVVQCIRESITIKKKLKEEKSERSH